MATAPPIRPKSPPKPIRCICPAEGRTATILAIGTRLKRSSGSVTLRNTKQSKKNGNRNGNKKTGVGRMTHEARQAARRPVEHEGARESSAPGEPREREVITPDWVALDDDTAVCEPAVTPPA